MDKVEKENRFTMRTMIPRVFKASLKAAIGYILFVLFSRLMAPLEGIYGYQTQFTALIALFLVFIFIIELAKDTIFQHIFSIANSLMIAFYFAYILNTSVFNISIEQINLMVDMRFFFSLFVLGGLLGFAKSMLRFLSWMNEREERWLRYQIKSL